MNIGRAIEYRNSPDLFIDVNLLKIVGFGLQKIFFDFILRNVDHLCVLDFGAGR